MELSERRSTSHSTDHEIVLRILTTESQCGTCWQLSYSGRTINVLAIDHAASGFNIAEAALNELTNGQAEALGRIDATAVQVAVSECGL